MTTKDLRTVVPILGAVALAGAVLYASITGLGGRDVEYLDGNGNPLGTRVERGFLNDVASDFGRELRTDEAVTLTIWKKMACSGDRNMVDSAEEELPIPMVEAAYDNLTWKVCNG